MEYENKWYKVWFEGTYYTGEKFISYEYAYGPAQVARLVEKLNAFKVTEWKID